MDTLLTHAFLWISVFTVILASVGYLVARVIMWGFAD
jgi:hypothetical protein